MMCVSHACTRFLQDSSQNWHAEVRILECPQILWILWPQDPVATRPTGSWARTLILTLESRESGNGANSLRETQHRRG